MKTKKVIKFIANWIIRASVWTFFLHVAAATIYYTHWEIYSRTGIQADTFSSVVLVLLMVAGAFFVARPVLEKVIVR